MSLEDIMKALRKLDDEEDDRKSDVSEDEVNEPHIENQVECNKNLLDDVQLTQVECNKNLLDKYNVCDNTLIQPYTTTNLIDTNLSIDIEELFYQIPVREDYNPPKKKRGRKKVTEVKQPINLNDGDITGIGYKDMYRGVVKRTKKPFKNATGMNMYLKENFETVTVNDISIIIPRDERVYKFNKKSVTDIINIDSVDYDKFEKYEQSDYFEYVDSLITRIETLSCTEDVRTEDVRTEGTRTKEKEFVDMVTMLVSYFSKHTENKDRYLIMMYIFEKIKVHSASAMLNSVVGIFVVLKYTDIELDFHLIKKCIIYILDRLFCVDESPSNKEIDERTQILMKLL